AVRAHDQVAHVRESPHARLAAKVLDSIRIFTRESRYDLAGTVVRGIVTHQHAHLGINRLVNDAAQAGLDQVALVERDHANAYRGPAHASSPTGLLGATVRERSVRNIPRSSRHAVTLPSAAPPK